ncbi:hypothetical protein V6Z11_D12G104500 [Gossypium hirsutum]
MARLSSKGCRRRNQMCRTQGANDLWVTYPNFHLDLFKKVCELCTLFSIEIILVIISPSGQVFTHGDLDFDANMKGLSKHGKLDFFPISYDEVKRIKNLLKEYPDVREKLKAARLRVEQLQKNKMESQKKVQALWAKPIGKVSLEELKIMDSFFKYLIEKCVKHRQGILAKAAALTSLSAGGSNSSLNGSSVDPHEHCLCVTPLTRILL